MKARRESFKPHSYYLTLLLLTIIRLLFDNSNISLRRRPFRTFHTEPVLELLLFR